MRRPKMNKQMFKSKFWLIIILCLVFILPSTDAFSQQRGQGGHGGQGGRGGRGGHQGGRGGRGGWSHGGWGHSGIGWWDWGYHHPRGYHWYNNSWWLGEAIVEGLVIGATISALPPDYKVVYIGRTPYYYDGVYYYQAGPSGYVVVNPQVAPAVVTTSPAAPTITINVPNSKGGYTQVQLTRYKDGYLGPQGEYYPGNPSIDQLKALYGQ
ncbi:MAG: hypothetical protein Q8O30_04560 [Candidatus Omnitrophota bacterium]|nr:hypothetical protein [Candidatus Omnitrophota bacterium]